MEIKGNMIIGFKKVRGNNEVVIKANNPLTGLDIEPEYATASIVHVQKVCELAWSAFKEYRHSTAHERADFLNTIASNIENLGEVLIDRAMLETGLPKVRLEGERTRTCNQLRLFASEILKGKYLDIRVDEAMPDRMPLPRSDLRFQKISLGPVAVFGASNFPLAFSVAGGDTGISFSCWFSCCC